MDIVSNGHTHENIVSYASGGRKKRAPRVWLFAAFRA